MTKIVIAGGPHTGKTTLLEALKKKYKRAVFLPEPATRIIQEQQALVKKGWNQEGVFPWNRYPEFVLLASAQSVLQENGLGDEQLVFLDRCLIDNIGYANYFCFNSIIPALNEVVEVLAYDLVFFCQPVGVYSKSLERHESYEEALAVHEVLKKAYLDSQVRLEMLPAVDVEGRLDIIEKKLRELQLY